MPFFEDLPAPEPHVPQRYVEPEWRRIPREVIPVTLPLGRLVHRSDEAALILHALDVFPTGFTFTLTAILHPDAGPRDAGLHAAFHGGGPYGPLSSDAIVRVGLRYADGRTAQHPDRSAYHRPNGRPEASLTTRGGGGSTDSATIELFAWPLPAEGDLELLFQWKSEGLEEQAVLLSGEELRAAAGATTEIWPGAQVPAPPERDGPAWTDYA